MLHQNNEGMQKPGRCRLSETHEVAGPLGPEALRRLTDPANYLGAAQAMVDRVLDGR